MPSSKIAHSVTVIATADNCLLSRICNILTTMDILPVQLRAVADAAGNNVIVEIDVPPTSATKLDLLTRKLAQMVLVESVAIAGG